MHRYLFILTLTFAFTFNFAFKRGVWILYDTMRLRCSAVQCSPSPQSSVDRIDRAALVNCIDELANASKWSVCSLWTSLPSQQSPPLLYLILLFFYNSQARNRFSLSFYIYKNMYSTFLLFILIHLSLFSYLATSSLHGRLGPPSPPGYSISHNFILILILETLLETDSMHCLHSHPHSHYLIKPSTKTSDIIIQSLHVSFGTRPYYYLHG